MISPSVGQPPKIEVVSTFDATDADALVTNIDRHAMGLYTYARERGLKDESATYEERINNIMKDQANRRDAIETEQLILPNTGGKELGLPTGTIEGFDESGPMDTVEYIPTSGPMPSIGVNTGGKELGLPDVNVLNSNPQDFDSAEEFDIKGKEVFQEGNKVGNIDVRNYDDIIHIQDIEINKKGKGTGTKIFEQLKNEADMEGKKIVLTSDAMRGKEAQSRQRKLYDKLFTKNKGDNKVNWTTEEYYYVGNKAQSK